MPRRRESPALPRLDQVRRSQPARSAQPFIVANNETYNCPIQPTLMFFVLYRVPFYSERQPGIYLYYPGVGTWRCIAQLHELVPDQWFQVVDEDGNQWPLAMCLGKSGSLTAQWLV